MSDEDIKLEFEAAMCDQGEELKTCPVCGLQTYAKACPANHPEQVTLTGDDEADDLFRRLENGEDVDLNKLDPKLKAGVVDDFVAVIPGSAP